MISLAGHIERAREQPHHIRSKIAFTLAIGLTAIIAFIWLIGSIATGAFAIRGSTFAEATSGATLETAAPAPASASSLLGAVTAAFTGVATAAHIEIVDTARTSTLDQKKAPVAEPTVIPF